MAEDLIKLLELIFIVGVACGIAWFIVMRSPLVEPFKGWVAWGCLAVGGIIILIKLLAMIGLSL